MVSFAFLAALIPGGAGAAEPVWLCKPGIPANPCAPSLDTTFVSPSGETLRVKHVKPHKHPKIDCFYVYPTVSGQPTANANLSIDPEERSVALYQAARYSQECRVFAPMYRQITIAALIGAAPGPDVQLAYSDVLGAWNTYLQKYNHGRGVVLIGHSQGTGMLSAGPGADRPQSRRAKQAGLRPAARRPVAPGRGNRPAGPGRGRQLPEHPGLPLGDAGRLRRRLLHL
jgi:hypothetical protein